MKIFLTLILIICMLMSMPLWAEQELAPLSCDESATSTALQYGQHVECKLDASSEVDIFTFRGEAGEKIHIYTTDLTSNYHGLKVSLYDEENYKIGYSSSSINPTLPTSGTYRIEITASSRTLYRLAIDCFICNSNTENVLAYGQIHTDRINYINDNDYFRFFGLAWTTVEIQRRHVGGYFSVIPAVYVPSGIKLSSIGSTLEVDLIESGYYTIWFDGSSEGIYELGVNCISGDCPSGMESDLHSIEFKNGMAYCMDNPATCVSGSSPSFNTETQILSVPSIGINDSTNPPIFKAELKYIPDSQPVMFELQSIIE